MSAPDTIVTLGSFAFERAEVPERIPWGGRQNLSVQELIGGARVVDAMGRSDRTLEWSGIFVGSEALSRARLLDSMRVAGLPLVLSWSELSFLVLIEDFEPHFERFYQVPYRIACVVVQDLTQPISPASQLGVDEVVVNDLGTADGIVGQLNAISADVQAAMAPVTAAVATVQAAVKEVSSIATAANSVVQSILVPVAEARTAIATLTSQVGNAIENIATVGGVFPNSTVEQSIATFNDQVSNLQQQSLLVQLDSVMGRIQQNVGNTQADADLVTQAGGNLFDLAAKKYSDATKWADIARVNRIGDPRLSGINTVKLPKKTGNTGGIYDG